MIEIRVETLLTEFASPISTATSATEAAQYLRAADVHALVVVDADDDVVGVVTESDLVALVAEERTDLPASAFMSAPAVTTTPETTVLAAAERMRETGVKHLPVVDDGVYRGLVSASDLAPYVSRRRLRITWQGEPFTAPEETELQAAD